MKKNLKKRAILIASSSVLAYSGVVSITSCSTNNKPAGPIVNQKRSMNPNVPNIIVGDFRLQILNKSTVRFEYKYQNPIFGTYDWLDDDTLFIPERTLYEGIDKNDYQVTENASHKIVSFDDITIYIPKDIKADLKGIVVDRNINGVVEHIYNSNNQQSHNNGELPNPEETKDVYELIDYPRIIEPPFGYSTSNLEVEPYKSHLNYFQATSGFEIQNHKDIYLTFPKRDAKALRKQYRNLAGAAEMVRLSSLGAWDSRYYPYDEKTAQQEVDLYYKNNLPLDNLVIDTDWRAGFSGKGYFVNETLFPNMQRFLKSMHDQNIEVCFNDHPEPQKNAQGQELDVLNPQEVQFRRTNLKKFIDMGLDTWWYDRNWSTSLICPTGAPNNDEAERWLNHEVWGDYLFNNVTKQAYMQQAINKYQDYGVFVYKRPTIMANVIQIGNGNWNTDHLGETGFTDSASHRYSLQWTGDQNSSMLDQEVANVVKTGIRSMPYMSSDLTGHTFPMASDYYYQRWIQYGALSPIFRIHCTRDLPIHAQPWLKSPEILENFRNWINLRYRLMPLYYSLARESYDDGMPICRALAFNYPDEFKTWGMENQYLIGNNILFAPCMENTPIKLFPGTWKTDEGDPGYVTKWFKTKDFTGEAVEVVYDNIHEINFDKDKFAEEAKAYIDQTEDFSVIFNGEFTPSENGQIILRSDDGAAITVIDEAGNKKQAADMDDHAARDLETKINLEAGKKYTIEIKYFNAKYGAELYFKKANDDITSEKNKEVYLPKGQWLDLFHGNTYNSNGETFKSDEYSIKENALFMRLGSMTPLLDNARNTKEQDWTNLVYDVYPTTTEASDTGILYEDDHETVAYQSGYYHTSDYGCYYDKDKGEFVIKLDPADGWYIGDDAVMNRKYTIRLHKTCNSIGDVFVDGNKVNTNTIAKNTSIAMPLNFTGASKTEDVIEVEIPFGSVRTGHEIRVKIN